MGKTKAILLGLALCLASGASHAVPVYVDGTIEYFFDPTGEPIGHTIDYLTFDVTAGTAASFNVRASELDWNTYPPAFVDLNGDGVLSLLDSMLIILDSGGTPLTGNDDSSNPLNFADGSVDMVDSYLEYTFATGGTYTLYISSFWLTRDDITSGFNDDPWESQGTYRLTFDFDGSMTNLRQGTLGRDPEQPVVPEPATLSLMGLGLGGLALRRLRRRG